MDCRPLTKKRNEDRVLLQLKSKKNQMATTLTIKGQVTIPKNIRDALDLQPGCKINFAVSDSGDVLLQKADSNRKLSTSKKSKQVVPKDRFEKVRGRADIAWRTQDLMNLLRGEH